MDLHATARDANPEPSSREQEDDTTATSGELLRYEAASALRWNGRSRSMEALALALARTTV
jgi:hypothetical protein